MAGHPVIAAVKDVDKIDLAITKPVDCLFLLCGEITNIQYIVKTIKKNKKRVFLHTDFIDGLAQNAAGIRYISEVIKPDGIITTKEGLVRSAKKYDLLTVQRVFVLDSHSIDTALNSICRIKPDAVETMPGIATKAIGKFSKNAHCPVIAGGLIETREEAIAAINAGAVAVSASRESLWDMRLSL